MKMKNGSHAAYYIALGLMFLLGISLIIFIPHPLMKKIIALMMTFLYVLWGIIHHVSHHDTSAKIVLEYVLIGTLGIAIVLLAT